MPSTRPIKLDDWGISWEEYNSAEFGDAMYLSSIVRDEIDRMFDRLRHDCFAKMWISVDERLPDFDGEYIVTVRFDKPLCLGNMTKRCEFTKDFAKRFGYGENIPMWYRAGQSNQPEPAETALEHIIAWMPYPKPYLPNEFGG